MSPLDAGVVVVGVVVVGVVVVGVVEVGVVEIGVVEVGVVAVGVVEVGVVVTGGAGRLRGARSLVVGFLTASASILLLFPALLGLPARSLAAPALMATTRVPAFFTLLTIRPNDLWFRFLITFTCFAFALPESLTSAAEKPCTRSLNETVKRSFGLALGLGWPAARLTFTAGRVQS
ncbi:MAG: hypothetical protein ACYDHO_03220 [Gaiellaceae bacterium]